MRTCSTYTKESVRRAAEMAPTVQLLHSIRNTQSNPSPAFPLGRSKADAWLNVTITLCSRHHSHHSLIRVCSLANARLLPLLPPLLRLLLLLPLFSLLSLHLSFTFFVRHHSTQFVCRQINLLGSFRHSFFKTNYTCSPSLVSHHHLSVTTTVNSSRNPDHFRPPERHPIQLHNLQPKYMQTSRLFFFFFCDLDFSGAQFSMSVIHSPKKRQRFSFKVRQLDKKCVVLSNCTFCLILVFIWC